MGNHSDPTEPQSIPSSQGESRSGGLRDRLLPPLSLAWWLPFLIYLLVAGLGAWAQREQMNGDGVAYLRHALYLSEGRWADSVSGYWSPLLIWSMAPLIGLGMDGVYAGHLAMVIWGLVLLGASYFFLGRFTRLSARWATAAMVLLALKYGVLVAGLLTPDIGFAALLLIYGGLSLDAKLLTRPSWSWVAGALGGLAYLAKSYGLPFFLSHFTLMIASHYWLNRRTSSFRQMLVAWAIGIVGFLLIAGPWIGVLSVKHGRPTFSTVAKVAHSVGGPSDMPRAHPTDELRAVPAGRITVWEVPHTLPYNHWSPLASRSYFIHQLKVVWSNLLKICATLTAFDLLHLFPAAFVLLPLAFLAQGNLKPLPRTIWLWLTVGLYLGGFLPIFYEGRYIYPFVWPLCALYLFDVLAGREGLGSVATELPSRTRKRVLTMAAALCAISLSWPILYELQANLRNPARRIWRDVAAEINQGGLHGPMASSPGLKTEGMITAYLANEPFLGPAAGQTVAEVEATLQKFGVQLLLVRTSKWPLAEDFLRNTTWRRHKEWTIDDAQLILLTPRVP